MSLWSAIGDFFGGDRNNAPTAYNQGQVAALSPEEINAIQHPGSAAAQQYYATHNTHSNILSNSGAVTGAVGAGSNAVGAGLSALAYVPNQALHGLSAAYNVGDVANAHGQSQWHPLVSLQDWKNAWNATSGFMSSPTAKPSFGASVYHSAISSEANKPTGGVFGSAPANQADLKALQDEQGTWTGKISAGVIDTVSSWYADPTILGGKVAARARVASKIPDAAAAEGAVSAATDINQGLAADRGTLNAGRLVSKNGAGLFSKGMEESGQRLFQFVKSTDDGANAAGRQVLLSHTPEVAPVLGLLDQADKITDLDLQRQVKIDILGAGQGSTTAMQRLVQNAPELARASQRASLAPEGREALDSLHEALADANPLDPKSAARAGQAWVDAADSFGTVENRAEIAALHNKALRGIHDSMERLANIADTAPLGQAGLTALDRSKAYIRNKVAQDFHYQDGPSSRTVRVLHWTSNQRFRGTISVDNQIRGNQELMDWMSRAKITDPGTGKAIALFSGDEKRIQSEKFLTAKTQEQRRRMVDALSQNLYGKIGAVHGKSAEWAKRMGALDVQFRQGSVRYATKELERARMAGDDVVTLDDPHFGTPTRIKAALLETHVANNVMLPDATMIAKTVRQKATGQITTGDMVAARAARFNNYADHFNNVWRLAVLGRPGLLVRTQIDSQGRALAVMGGTSYVHSALGGIKNWTLNDLSKQGWAKQDLVDVNATAADHAYAQELRDEAQQLHATAARLERIGKQRRGAISAPVVVPTLEDRGAILRGEEKNTDLPVSGDSLAQMTPAAMRARAELKIKKAEDLESRTYQTRRYRQGAQDFEVDLGKGRKMTTRLGAGGQDLKDFDSAVYKGGRPSDALTQTVPQTMGDVLNNAIAREQKRLYEDSKNWITHNPGDPQWAAGWIRTMDQFRNSYVGHRILETADLSTADMIRDLRADKQVEKVWREVRGDNEDFGEWLARVTSSVIWNAPTKEVREALLTRGHMSPDEVNKMFAKPGEESNLPEQMHVQGPQFTLAPPAGSKIPNSVHKMIAALSDVPDLVAARHPVLLDRYRYHVTNLGQRELDRTGEQALTAAAQAKIETIARHRAIQDTQQIFYDTAKHTGAHNSLRYVSPFVGAWQDAIESWSRLFYDNPATAGAFNKIWNAPNRMGMVVDQNGDAVAPGQQANQTFLVLPMEFSNSFKSAKRMTIRKDSLNSIFQGAQWYTPGVGPIVQIPAQELVARVYPELGDSNNPLVRTILPFGTPKTAAGGGILSNLASDIANSTAPSYAKALYSMVNPNDPNNSQAYLASVNQQIIDARKAGRPIPNAATLDKNAAAAARSAGFVRAISIWGLGVSGQSSTVADFYKKQYDLLNSQAARLHAQGTTPSAEFVKQFPEAAGLQWSLSKSQTGVNATLQAFQDERKYSKQIKANPAYGWFYVGASNLSPTFSQSVYNAQSSRTLGLPGSGAERQRQTRSQVIDSSLAEDGWTKYNQINLAISAASAAPNANKDAIANAKRVAVAALRQQNPSWAKDFDNQDSGKLQRFIETIATPALADPKLKTRTDIVAMGQYLSARQQVLDFLKTKGLTSLKSKSAAPLAAALNAVGQQLADQNLGFQQMWTRMFSSEVGDVKAPLAEAG